MSKAWKTLKKAEKYITYYREGKWTYIHEKMDNLWNSLSAEDKELFSFNFEALDLADYASTFTLGSRVYLLNDDVHTLPEARERIKR